ncbi:MAG TPA: GrpB family protein [Gaiellaceae bacterium]|nr:GrpB family protein [Gaiellaceae bacterium]
MIGLQPARELRELVSAVVADRAAEIGRLLPEAEIVHTGGTSLDDALTRGDVDLHVRVPASDFPEAVAALERRYEPYRPEMWTDAFAAFLVPEERRLPTGVALTALGAEHDRRFTRGWELLRTRPELLAEYNALKQRFEGTNDEDDYGAAKTAFFTRLETGA